ncbi:hypothetical protein D3C81_2132720 [compost metagenome]
MPERRFDHGGEQQPIAEKGLPAAGFLQGCHQILPDTGVQLVPQLAGSAENGMGQEGCIHNRLVFVAEIHVIRRIRVCSGIKA